MGIKIQTSNAPVDEHGKGALIEVGEAEFVDLSRMGLVVAGRGDVSDDGTLSKAVQKRVDPETITAASQLTPNGENA